MGYYIGAAGYYEGDKVSNNDAEVPQRPDATYEWDFQQSLWAQNSAKVATAVRKAQDETENQEAKLDGPILNLVNQSKAEWVTWAQANFPTLTNPEKVRLGNLFWVVSIGVRNKLRNGN